MAYKQILFGFLITIVGVVLFAALLSYAALKGESPNELITPLAVLVLTLSTFAGVFYTVKVTKGGRDGIVTGAAVLATVLLLCLGFGSFSLPIPLGILFGAVAALFLGVKRKKSQPKKRARALKKRAK